MGYRPFLYKDPHRHGRWLCFCYGFGGEAGGFVNGAFSEQKESQTNHYFGEINKEKQRILSAFCHTLHVI